MILGQIIGENKSFVFDELTLHQQNVLSCIEKCRTPALGAHLYYCEDCNNTYLLNNSCGNRNCPVCQGSKRKKWIKKQCDNLVNVPYFHVVFTLPHVLNSLVLGNQAIYYNTLFKAAWQTLETFFRNDPQIQGKGSMLSILHTWGQNLAFHPHIHCLVPAAGIDKNGDLKIAKGQDKFLFNVKALGKMFRAKFAAGLTRLEKSGAIKVPPLVRRLMFDKQWVVFSQRPFSTPINVVRYIGMYSHRVAISQNRIIANQNGITSFYYKDYKDAGKKKIMNLGSREFLRRFSMHILPLRFTKIRYYGLLNNRLKKQFVQKAQMEFGEINLNFDELSQTNNLVQETIGEANDEGHPEWAENAESEFDDQLDDMQSIKPNYRMHCPKCKSNRIRILAVLSKHEIIEAVAVVNNRTGELFFNSRDGPITQAHRIIEI
jgi:hypothetical protein